jgi:hypothetical protein
LGKYQNNSGGKNDNVFIYISQKFSELNQRKNLINRIEVRDQKWFKFNNLPNVSAATKRRIDEILVYSNEQEVLEKNW